MISTTIFTTVLTPSKEYLAIPRTLSLQKRTGSGKILLDTTRTVFHRDWQLQLQTVSQFVQKFFGKVNHDFLISVDTGAVSGWSTSIPLGLLFASALTGEPLPNNIFSTGCMFSPDGWVSHGKFNSTQAKIDASERFAQYKEMKDPLFIVPFSHQYISEKVTLCYVTSIFSAFKRALPHLYKEYIKTIKTLSHVQSQDALQNVLDHLPAGNVFVAVSASQNKCTDPVYSPTEIKSIPFIYENVLPDNPVYLYCIKDSTVLFKYSYKTIKEAFAAASEYVKVLP